MLRTREVSRHRAGVRRIGHCPGRPIQAQTRGGADDAG